MTAEPQPPSRSERRPLAMVRPPKPISEMTSEEIHNFAQQLVKLASTRMKDKETEHHDDEPRR
jgi:hypothetical protein